MILFCKRGFSRAKEIVFGKSDCISAKGLYSGKSGCNRAN